MRQKLNENPVAQIAVVAVLLLGAGYLLLTTLHSGSSASSEASGTSPSAPTETGASTGSTPASAAASVSAPSQGRLPQAVERAYASDSTIVLLVYRPGGIDDHLVGEAAGVLDGMPGVSLFEVPVKQVARYAAITGPLGVNQAPALVVVRSRRLNDGAAAPATVTYGFQSASDVAQAVRDADYRGPELTYAPN